MALTKYIKAPFAGSVPQYIDSELRKIETALTSIERTLQPTEGVWTPAIIGASTAGVGTYTLQRGYYYQIGNFVVIGGRIIWSAHTGTGTARIDNIPFPAADASSSSHHWIGAGVTIASTAFTGGPLLLQSNSSVSHIRQYANPHNGAPVAATGDYIFTLAYAKSP